MIVLPEECDIVDPIGAFSDALRAAVQVRGAISGAMAGFTDAIAARATPVVVTLPDKKATPRGDLTERMGDFVVGISAVQTTRQWFKFNG